MENVINVFKPKGPSSFGIIREIKKIFPKEKVGHAGTLDPLAEGVLVVAVGRAATKKIDQVVKKEKEYLASITLGQTSATDDEEGEKTIISKKPALLNEVKKTLKEFEGEIMQRPPKYSAVKIKGKRAYRLARQGINFKIKPRPAIIKKMTLVSYAWPNLKIEAVTGPGVYIRSLARDIGNKLGCGAFLAGLIRTRVGDFKIENSLTIEKIKNRANAA